MAVKKLKDDEGNVYDVEMPDDDEGEADDDDSEKDTVWLDEEDIEWLRRKRREESEASRTSATKTTKTSGTSNKVVKIRAKQPSTGSRSATTRKRTLRLA